MYLTDDQQKVGTYKKILKENSFDTVYFNSFFSMSFTLLPLLAIRFLKHKPQVILAPRGMLGNGALAIKAFKKRTFILVAKLIGLYRNVTWHASTPLEAEEVYGVFGEKAQVKVAQNIAMRMGDSVTPRIKEVGKAKFFFLSRVAIKKNLLMAIQLLSEVKGEIEFDIIGPIDEEDYWNECQKEIRQLSKPNLKINYKGAIPYYELPEILSTYHFFILPKQNENYGHVIVEALASGCPVIISDQTPWQNLKQKGIGWDIPLKNKASFSSAIDHAVKMDQEEFDEMSQKSFQFVEKEVYDEGVVTQNRKLFANE